MNLTNNEPNHPNTSFKTTKLDDNILKVVPHGLYLYQQLHRMVMQGALMGHGSSQPINCYLLLLASLPWKVAAKSSLAGHRTLP